MTARTRQIRKRHWANHAEFRNRRQRLRLERLEDRRLLVAPGGVDGDLAFWLNAEAGITANV